MVTLFVILSYYAVVGGWVMKYIFVYLMGAGFEEGADAYQTYFVNFIEKPVEPLIWGLLFLVICIYVVVRGVSAGIERMSKILMPVLFLILIACVVRAVTLPGAADGVAFMLTVNPEDFNRDTLVGALGQAFFSLSVGMGIMVTYGSYVPKKENLVKSAAWICFLDTMVAILSAFAIIPVVFVTLGAEGLGMGGGFAFMALPEVFAGFPGGVLESCCAFITEEWKVSRLKAAVV